MMIWKDSKNKIKIQLLWLSIFIGVFRPIQGHAAPEIINHVPGFHLYQSSSKLASSLGDDGLSMLCFPTSLAHLLIYQRSIRSPSFPSLLWPTADTNSDQKINGFDLIYNLAQSCGTNKNSGTWYSDAITCSRSFYEASGFFSPSVESLGLDGKNFSLANLRQRIRKDAGVILLVGWYRRVEGKLVRRGGHFVNVYGYKYDPLDTNKSMTLYVVNPLINYIGRTKSQTFDPVELTLMEREPDLKDHSDVYHLSGKGFDFKNGVFGILENALILSPVQL